MIGARLALWRIISSIEQKEESRGNKDHVSMIRDYKSKIESELSNICNGILKLLDTRLIPSAATSDSKVFCLKMKGEKIPRSLGNCTSLKITNLEDNDLIGEVPLKIENLQNLMQLSFTNSSLTGLIPYAIFNSSKIEVIGLYMNYFSGHLPSSMGHLLPNLKALYLWENELNGIIPNSISNAPKFINLQLGANHFSGSIPNTLENLRLLEVLNLASNNFTSESSTLELMFLSYLTKCINLTSIVVANNPLNGTLPISIGNFSTSLEQFVAYNCSIKGIIPIGIGNLSNLVTLYLEDNELVGSIPTTDGIIQLQRLHLQDNRLQGLIPNDICQLNNLDELFLNHNELFGTIPTCWGGLSKLQKLYLDSNQLTFILPILLES
ncbi:hypothetical protein CMV_029322 [Castanea mollissima]|uniref:14-3-3 domain-containing protein n=1 Tax=Castanea mollissima TaxID=60419 RepID=A0A8J4V0R6_9ROSI|nr:hypothetical protein CMV_029322 [Castanea mollissima]